MRCLLWSVGLCVAVAAVAGACGSSDKQVRRPEQGGAGGEAGEAGARAGSAGNGGSSSGGVPSDAGQGGMQPSSAAGEGGVTASDALGGDGGASMGEGGSGGAAVLSDVVIDLGFGGEGALPTNLDPGTAMLTPSQGYEGLGPVGNQFGNTFLRGPTGAVITLTLADLPAHRSLSLSLLFAAIDSLDGTGTFPAGDFFKITLDGDVVFRESFANATPDEIQSYDPPPAAVLARHVDLGFGGPGGYYTDSAYDFGQDPRFQNLPHAGSTATLVFTMEGEGVQSLDDESWAIDNLRVTVNP